MAGTSEVQPFRVLVTGELPDGSLDLLTPGRFEIARPSAAEDRHRALIDASGEADAIISLLTDTIDREVIAAGAGRLKVIANVAVGYDNIDLRSAAAAHVTVCNTPGVLDETTADLAFALILMASRATTEAEAALRGGRWEGWNMTDFLGHDVYGATLAVVGWGQIGQAVGRRAQAFGMRVLHHSRRPTNAAGYVADLDELLARADVVTLHVPLSEATWHLIDKRRLAQMKRGAVLVNTSRGPVIDEAAVADALHAGELFAAGLDVYESEPSVYPHLLDAPRAVLLPHIGSATTGARLAMARSACAAVVEVLAGRLPPNAVVTTR